MYAVGQPHPLKSSAREFFFEANESGTPLCTSAEVLQELAHVYLPAGRLPVFDASMELLENAAVEVWPLEAADVSLARQLHNRYPHLRSRDLCHLASCRRRGVRQIMTFDEALASVSGGSSGSVGPDPNQA